MAEKCIATIDNNSIMSIIGYNTEKNIINQDNHILIPYDNTPIISLNNSESDLNIITSISCCGVAGEVVEQCNIKTIKRESNCDSVDIYLETPAIDDQNLLEAKTIKHIHEKIAVIPKRLSDEFFSADDDGEEESEELEKGENIVMSEIIIPKREGVLVLKEIDVVKLQLPSTSSLNNVSSNYDNEVSNKIRVDSEDQIEEDDDDDDDDDDDSDDDNEDDDEVINLGGIYDHNDVQSMDAIERIDYEEEQKLTGGVIVRNSSLICNANRLNIGLLNNLATNNDHTTNRSDEDNKRSSQQNSLATTPTSSRSRAIRTTKTTVKLNLSKHDLIDETDVNNKIINTHGESSMNHLKHQPQFVDAFLLNSNSNSNDSLSSDKTYNIRVLNCDSVGCSTKYGTIINEPSSSKNSIYNLECDGDVKIKNDIHSSASKKSLKDDTKVFMGVSDSVASTSSSSSPNGQYSECQPGDEEECCCEENAVDACDQDKSNINEEPESSSSYSNLVSDDIPIVVKSNQKSKIFDLGDYPATSSASVSRRLSQTSRNLDESILKQILPELIDNEFDEDTWADCEEGSDTEEICTCRNYAEEDERNASSEDELPSKDVDLSGYTNIGALSDDILQDATNSESPRIHRKRKLTENRSIFGDNMCCGETTPGGRKRLALENCALSPNLTPSSHLVTSPSIFSNTSLIMERRTPRSIIPTKDNPPPELYDWLLQFQRWSHAERIVAIDRLIENCEPTQVRHMMKVIEPQFQRDFISLLPKELALQVLSYLEPMDLLRAAQTCRSWRFLCDDNLLWKEKCKEANIVMEQSTDRPKRGRAGNMPPISSPWKAAFMRQHIIEMNWRSRLIRGPKILKGHDDHVITCLQFCGNRIVSGSDDNTLKVWSAISGKCLRTLVGHTGGVWSSQMSGNTIISGSTDRTLKVWNADSGQCTHTLFGHTSTVRCMHLHANKVVSGSRDATLRVWDIDTGVCLHVLVGHLAAVRCVQYDGKFVVSGAYDYMVKVWNPERQECLHTLQGHTNRVYSLQFDGVHVVSGSLDTSIRVWDAESGTCKHTLMGHQSLTSGMELRSNILVSGNADSTVKVWDIVTGQCLQTLSGPSKHQSAVTCLQFNSRFVVTSSDDGTVKLWDVKTGEFIRNLVTLDSGGSGGVVWRIRSNDTKLVCAVGSRNGTEETKLMVLDFDVEGACLKCS